MKPNRTRRLRRAAIVAVSTASVAATVLGVGVASTAASPASMRTDWARFARTGNASSRLLPWPSFGDGANVLSLVPLQSQVTTDFAAAHHCSFWAAA